MSSPIGVAFCLFPISSSSRRTPTAMTLAHDRWTFSRGAGNDGLRASVSSDRPTHPNRVLDASVLSDRRAQDTACCLNHPDKKTSAIQVAMSTGEDGSVAGNRASRVDGGSRYQGATGKGLLAGSDTPPFTDSDQSASADAIRGQREMFMVTGDQSLSPAISTTPYWPGPPGSSRPGP